MMPTEVKRRRVRRGRFDRARMTVTLGTGTKETSYTCNGLSATVQSHLLLLGLKTSLLMSKNADDAYKDLRAGTVPEQRALAGPRKSKWREAIACALATAKVVGQAPKGTRKSAIEQLVEADMPAMREHVATLGKEVVRKLADQTDVQDQYRRLFGPKAAEGQKSLFELAGIVAPRSEKPSPGGNDYAQQGQDQAAD